MAGCIADRIWMGAILANVIDTGWVRLAVAGGMIVGGYQRIALGFWMG
jgi:hypothetical protein